MTTVKRVLDSPVPPEEATKRRGSKPGRKPLDTEAKNKRTAQNRAAQRAFRERKEQKMRELEDKVRRLERVQEQNEMESEFLRGQLQQLVAEIQQYRPQRTSDSQVLQYLAKSEEQQQKQQQRELEQNQNQKYQHQHQHEHRSRDENGGGRGRVRSSSNSTSHSRSRSRSDGRNTCNTTPTDPSENSSPVDDNAAANAAKIRENMQRKMSFTFEYHRPSASSTSSHNNKSLPLLAHTPSTSSGSLDLFSYNTNSDNQSLPKFTPSSYSNTLSNEFDFNSHFDEQVSEFCTQLNEVCGTRECPVPKKTTPPSLASSHPSPTIQRLHQSQLPSASSPSASSVKLSQTTQLPPVAQRQDLNQQPGQDTLTNSWDSPQFGQSTFGWDTDYSTNKWMFGGVDLSKTTGVLRAPSNTADSLPFIDASLAFPSEQQDRLFGHNSDDVLTQFFEEDPTVTQLTTEESNYDPFRPDAVSMAKDSYSSSEFVESGQSASESSISTAMTAPDQQFTEKASPFAEAVHVKLEQEDVVPSRDGHILKCSEIWDRVTAHPKYTDIDIDSLCFELRSKAKCSEKGVVVNSDDVQKALTKHMS
ncbi:LAME_0G13806g1_1 [Lachancea meyersii CBS 8951]|uniref:LAME_0G13806g1_1 n=1 Tax=Lachancea meyersii CBS 8951 TaxID=1266667 RepID=A0A1G4KA87_9SACH|nr:LAME_0G13806g1_1 [Lachancea meyersii CBS 8951]